MWRQRDEQRQVKQLLGVHGSEHLENAGQPHVPVSSQEALLEESVTWAVEFARR